MKNGYLYKLICPITNKCRYIGKTIQDLKKRLYKHKYDKRRNPSHKNSWLIELENKGLLNELKIELIEVCEIYLLNEREIFWIDKFKRDGFNLTNMTNGGDCGSLGHKHTNEAKRKISESAKKLKGIKRNDEFKKKISQSMIGNTRRLGYKTPEDVKEKISKSKQGVISWNAQTILQLNKNGDILKEWRSAKDAANSLDLSQGNIWSVANGNRETCGGYKWKLKIKYYNE